MELHGLRMTSVIVYKPFRVVMGTPEMLNRNQLISLLPLLLLPPVMKYLHTALYKEKLLLKMRLTECRKDFLGGRVGRGCTMQHVGS